MIQKENFENGLRSVKTVQIQSDFVVVGGGIAGVCAAISAARKGMKTTMIQDRPVLGGNSSSEVRLWILGATSHMGNNNRWAREGGVIDEILVENLYRNKEGNAILFDTILLEKVIQEENISLLLNTNVYEVEKSGETTISKVIAFCSQNSTRYEVSAPLFCDASGDGIVAFQAGASFRMGAETKEEFGELFAPDESYGELLGHSMYFYSKRADAPVKYVAPSFALKDIREIPRYKIISKEDQGCRFWWFEYGGRTDTIHQTEEIKWELWKVIYGVWDHIKNSGEFEDVDDLTLEWVATIPGKRESRRFEGLYMLKQQDLVEQRHFNDAVAHGGWAMDLHPADGIYSEKSSCTQWHTKGIYQIPYRCYVSKDINNLFLAGRIISATHVAFGSTRVMATSGLGAQAVGMAASICSKENLKPAELLDSNKIEFLQDELNKMGQSVPNVPIQKESNLISQATVTATSSLKLKEIPFDSEWISLKTSTAQLLPFKANQTYNFIFQVKVEEKTPLHIQLRSSSKSKNYTPDVILESSFVELAKGEQFVEYEFSSTTDKDQYAFVTFLANEHVFLKSSNFRFTGILSVFNGQNKAVSNNGKQTPPDGIGIDTFEFWIPYRRPAGKNIGMQISPALEVFDAENIANGFVRPWGTTNAWVADLKDKSPKLTIEWPEGKELSELKLFFDTDYDHPMESTLYGHPEDVVPFCVRNYKIKDLSGDILFEKQGNYQTINTWKFDSGFKTKGFIIEVEHPSEHVPAAIFEIFIE